MRISLAKAYAGLGKHDQAMNEIKKAGELAPFSQDYQYAVYCLDGQMEAYAMLGENDLALDAMAQIFARPSFTRGLNFTKNPLFENIWAHPRFQDLIGMKVKDNGYVE